MTSYSAHQWFSSVLTIWAFAFFLITVPTTLNAQTWTLAWSDEFNAPVGTPPDSSIWNFVRGDHQPNGEIERYCAPDSTTPPCDPKSPNLYQDGQGHLVVKAINKNGQWASGRINSAGKQAFQYGRIEARIKMQSGNGFWPAFWMMGDNQQKWPARGEIDIMEWIQRYQASITSSAVHGPGYSGKDGFSSRYTFPHEARIDDDFHTYGVIWSKDKLEFYRDNPATPFFTFTPSNLPTGAAWVYNQPFYLLLNFAIGGGGFPGTTDATTPETGVMLVDYVRVYRDAPANGLASPSLGDRKAKQQ